MCKHTAGPWKVSLPHITTDKCLGYMATMSRYPEAEADAHLIAAAPEMLSFLKKVRLSLPSQHWGEVDLIISRAEGRIT